MPVDYFSNVFIPQLRRYADIKVKLVKRGYYPKGGGKVEIKISPKFSFGKREEAPKIELLEQGSLQYIKGISHASRMLQDSNVAERQAKAAEIGLRELGKPVNIDVQYADTLSPGSGIALWAVFSKENDEISMMEPIIIGADTIGERGKPAEEVGASAASQLIKEINSGAPVDRCLADNLIPFLALFGGKIRVSEISKHTLANIYVSETFLGKKFEIDKEKNIISV
jgi:RNA 3'-phosphate cyclase